MTPLALLTAGLICLCGPAAAAPAARQAFQPAPIISFEDYASKFGKHYQLPAEALVHHKLYLARSIRAALSALEYKRGRLGFYLAVNEFTDATPAELASLGPSHVEPEVSKPQPSSNTFVDPQSHVSATAILNQQSMYPQNYYQVDSEYEDYQSHRHEDDLEGENTNRKLPDEVFIDWRRSGCITRVKHQLRCGSCYIFSALALWEYVYCAQTGELLEFSEQYVIDCGTRTGLAGCDGGLEWLVNKFTAPYGFELQLHYPYRGIDATCPYGPQGSDQEMGFLKVGYNHLFLFGVDELDKFLAKTPVTFSITQLKDLFEYGGGVYDCDGGFSPTGHAMLIMGSGREDGKEYWLFKNSWGAFWGHDGYLKINKNNTCMDHHMGTVPRAILENTPMSLGKNPDYNPKPVMDRYDNL